MSRPHRPTTLRATPRQQQVLSSPIRLEILGQFTSPEGMSIADVARRMGRPPGSLYYHFRILEKVGILTRVGKRSAAKKDETLFEPAASRFELATPRSGPTTRATIKTMTSAFRMAERDLEAALRDGTGRFEGPGRNFYAARMHCRLTKRALAELNRHLRAIERLLVREGRRKKIPPDADQYCSFTVALLPLRGREGAGPSPAPDAGARKE